MAALVPTPGDHADRADHAPAAGDAGRQWGRVVSIMSSGIRQPIPELSYSNACRSALAAWLKTISLEVMADGVTVNGVLPGRLDTARVASLDGARAERAGTTAAEVRAAFERAIPAGRYGDPDELGALRRLALLGPGALPDRHLRPDRRRLVAGVAVAVAVCSRRALGSRTLCRGTRNIDRPPRPSAHAVSHWRRCRSRR